MPGMFIFAIILAIIAALLAIGMVVLRTMVRKQKMVREARAEAQKTSDPGNASRNSFLNGPSQKETNLAQAHTWVRWFAVGFLVLALILTFFSSATIVSTKNDGIVTSFGKPTGSLSNGFHMVPPWAKVTELDAAIQTDSHYKGDKPTCISVRIVRQAVACADVSIRWRIKESASDQLFKDYRGFDNIRDSLVTRELNSNMNTEFKLYDPLGLDDAGNSTAPSSQDLSQRVTKDMQQAISSQIDVLNVIIGVVHFDGNTQSRVDALQAQVAQTRIAQQAAATAVQQALANKTLAQSLSNDPNVLVSRCYDLVNEMLSKGLVPPIAFNCWPGSGSSVVIPATSGSTGKTVK